MQIRFVPSLGELHTIISSNHLNSVGRLSFSTICWPVQVIAHQLLHIPESSPTRVRRNKKSIKVGSLCRSDKYVDSFPGSLQNIGDMNPDLREFYKILDKNRL